MRSYVSNGIRGLMKLMTLEKRVERHGIQLDKLEVFSNRLEERLDSLIKQLSTLNTTIKWFIALIVGAFVSFFLLHYSAKDNTIKESEVNDR